MVGACTREGLLPLFSPFIVSFVSCLFVSIVRSFSALTSNANEEKLTCLFLVHRLPQQRDRLLRDNYARLCAIAGSDPQWVRGGAAERV